MFAVVQFITESTNQEVSVSEVPASWVSDDQKQCWWPPSNTGIYIARQKEPNPDTWKLHPIKVECFCATLQEAKKRARSITSSDEETVRTFKPNRKYNSDQFELNYVDEYHDQLTSPLLLPVPPTSLITPSGSRPLSTTDDEFDARISKAIIIGDTPQSSPAESVVDAEPHILDISENIPDTVPSPTTAVLQLDVPAESAGTNHNCCRNFDIIIQLITELNVKVSELKDTLGNTKASFSREELDIIIDKLPFKSIEELEGFERSLLTDKKQEGPLKCFMNSIGGTTGRDFTQRLLKKLFTNELAELCSWTGAKNNFELQKLTIMECAYSAVISNFQITREEFEMHVKDWLRHARQRKERENKRNDTCKYIQSDPFESGPPSEIFIHFVD